MKPLTYLGFTIFSIFLQFCVMEFINGRIPQDKSFIELNESTLEKPSNILIKIKRKPHALFYNSETNRISYNTNNFSPSTKYNNMTLKDVSFLTTTDAPSTTFDVFYDENTSATDNFFTTDSFFPSSEYDNITEVTLLDKSSTTTSSPGINQKVYSQKVCNCNLLYKMCDINCCCDMDCTDDERSLFNNCSGDNCSKSNLQTKFFCNQYPACGEKAPTSILQDFFCIVKVNLPESRIKTHNKLNEAALNATFKWNIIEKPELSLKFKKKLYEKGDPILLFLNQSVITNLFLPTATVNNYCNSKNPVRFLINENSVCNVKLHDLYAFTVDVIKEAKVMSITELSLNSTSLNCSTTHCTNWTVSVCDNKHCADFNKSVHEPSCSDNYCDNVAFKVYYSFYYTESGITKACMKLYVRKIYMSQSIMMQEVDIKFYLGNESIDDILQLSGNPGYVRGLPVLVSYASNNHSQNFFNRTFPSNILFFPHNEDGKCVWSVTSKKTMRFGDNTRLKCRLNLHQISLQNNATSSCQSIQLEIKEYLKLTQKIFVSPYGNPQNISDENWMSLEMFQNNYIYGEYETKHSKLICYNLVTRFGFVIAFEYMSDTENKANKIIRATIDTPESNATFSTAELSAVITIDSRFIDVNVNRPVSEFAQKPQHLPAILYNKYPSNKCYSCAENLFLILCSCIVLRFNK